MVAATMESVQCFGRKNVVVVAYYKCCLGLIKINGCPIELVKLEILRHKVCVLVLLLGCHRFPGVDIPVCIKGVGHVSLIYVIQRSIAKALVAFYHKCIDEQAKEEIKGILIRCDRTLLVVDPCHCEPRKFVDRDACARFQKSYW